MRSDRSPDFAKAAALLALLALPLAGCLPDRASDVHECEVEASRFFQTYRAVDPDDPSSRYIIGCMAAKGYDFTVAPEACNSAHAMPTQAACYRSRTWLGRTVEQFSD